MFSCKEVADRASLFVDGELTTWQKLKISLHLAMCGACSAFVAQIRVARDLSKAAAYSEHRNEDDIAPIYARIRDTRPPVG